MKFDNPPKESEVSENSGVSVLPFLNRPPTLPDDSDSFSDYGDDSEESPE